MVSTMKSKAASKPNLSNLTLIAVIGILGTGILLDGILYNKAPLQKAIHNIGNVQTITAYIDSQQVVALKKVDNKWHQTHPISAPAQNLRVQPLLDTNKYSQRSYQLSELPHEEIFADAVTLKINDAEYQIGSVEPVSKLRYVRSGNQVYLQPDTLIPMLTAADTVFVDLTITSNVKSISIGDKVLEQPQAWSDLKGSSIVETVPAGHTDNVVEIRVIEDNQTRLLTGIYSEIGYTITTDQGYTYLLPDAIAETLGLTDLLTDS